MEMAIIYIGISQCLFASLLVFSKKPLGIADKILGIWLVTSSFLFIYNLVKAYFGIHTYVWQISFNLTIAFPEFLLLYSKYITTEQKRFKKKDLLYFTPSFITILIVFIYYLLNPNNFFSYKIDSGYVIWPLFIFKYLLIVCIWIYPLGSAYYVYRHKKQINSNYSFESHKINLSWLSIVIAGYFLTYNFMMVIIEYFFKFEHIEEVKTFLNGAQLIFIYLLSYFGFKQQQLISHDNSVTVSKFTLKESGTDKYQKSGLKESSKAEEYLKRLIDCMNNAEPWKDNELSVAKLSELSGIPKHHITQILNENLEKNFYTFVNEYRVEYAKKLIVSPKHKHWSIIAIGFESGFNSKAAFNNFFKKYTNMTPTEFRNINSK